MHENQYKTEFLRGLLQFLLAKYEKSKGFLTGIPSAKRTQFHFERNNPFVKDFQDEMDYRKREWMLEVISNLEQMGVISTTRDKFDSNMVKKIYLEPGKIKESYLMASMTPVTEKLKQLKVIIKPLIDHEWEWVKKWAQAVIQDFEQKKTGGLNVDDPDLYKDVVKVLQFLEEEEGNILIRNLSNRLFNDSKHFERKVSSTLLSVLKRAFDVEFENDEELLAFFGMVKKGRLVRVCGGLSWNTKEGEVVSISPFDGGIGLTDATIKSIGHIDLVTERLILIENLTSYEQWIHQRSDENELVIYTGGFPHKTLQHFLTKLSRSIIGETPVYHWGDIDIGGILIFNYIKQRFFKSLYPLFMDVETLKRLNMYAIPITATNRDTIKRMLLDKKHANWHQVLQALLETDSKLEQESIFDVTGVQFK